MAKVFTITEGLENLGALRTGGQGSVYKARRTGSILTAVKLIPTPIYNESEEDGNFRNFRNEVEKLKKVNEEPNPNVVKILSSGITESGSFPYIEMEYIEGPDLEELLKPPHDPVFTIKEAIKVADQLACALSHCHKIGVRHGDIKSNNVKFNISSGNYVLLDFGLAVMSDEQRRSSLRHAGAIEFMAPEQNEGKMLFQTDVYSFGIILFELLTGQVPFPLSDNGETSRNAVMLKHMEGQVPDLLAIRQKNLPPTWSQEKRDREMLVPDWLVKLIYNCLEKNPENRYSNGEALREAISLQSVSGGTNAELLAENERLRKQLEQVEQQVSPAAVPTPTPQPFTPETGYNGGNRNVIAKRSGIRLSVSTLIVIVIFMLLLVGIAIRQTVGSTARDKQLAVLKDSLEKQQDKITALRTRLKHTAHPVRQPDLNTLTGRNTEASMQTQNAITSSLEADSLHRDSIKKASWRRWNKLHPKPKRKKKKFLGLFRL